MSKLEERIAEIVTLTAKSGEIAADGKNEYHEQTELLKAKQAAVRQKIEEFMQACENAWEDLKSVIEPAWTALIF